MHFSSGGETHGTHELLRGVCEIKVFVRKGNGGRYLEEWKECRSGGGGIYFCDRSFSAL